MFVENQNNQDLTDEEKKQQANTPTVGAGGGGAQTVGGTSIPATGNFSTTSPVQGQQPVQQWATAQDYLKANQPQAEALGSKVQESLTGTLGEAKGAIDTGAAAAKSAIEAGTTPYNEALVTEAATSPTKVAGDEGKLADFLKQWNASYTGPESFETSESYTPAVTAAQTGTTKAAELGSTGGRENLIGNQFGVYGAGNKGLDQAILQQAPQYGQIQELAPQFAGLNDYLTQQATGVNAAATAAKTASEEAKAKTQGAFTGKLTDFQSQLMAKTQTAQQEAQKVADKYNLDLSQGNEDQVVADLKSAGASDKDLQSIRDYMTALTDLYKGQITPSQITSFNPATYITPENVATPEDYANAAAYQKLTGTDYSGILNPASVAQAGTAPTAAGSMKPADIQQYLQKNVATHDQELIAHAKDPNAVAQYLGLPSLNGYERTDTANGYKTAQYLIDSIRRQVSDPAQRIKMYDSYIPKGTDMNNYPYAGQQGFFSMLWQAMQNEKTGGYYNQHPEQIDPFAAIHGRQTA